MHQLTRRGFIGGVAALGAAGPAALWSSPLMAQAGGGGPLPARAEFTIANAYVMTMDPALGDIAGGSVHVRNGDIVAVGKDIAGGGLRIDGNGMIVMPGLVETHWHMWNTLYRSFAGDKPEEGYFPTVARFGAQMTPDDMFQGTRLAAAEAINSGTTYVHSWCHNVRSTAHAEADVRALAEVGIRARHSCGWPQGMPDTQMADQAPLETLAKDWKSRSNDGLITLGMAWRGQFRAGPIAPEVYRPEFENARRLGVPITVHVASARKAVNQIEPLFKAKLMGKDVQLIHTLSASPAELDMIKEAGCPVSVSPGSELRIGYGYPQISEMFAKGIPLGISVDTSALTGSSNLFAILEARARFRERQGGERVQDDGAPRARARHHRRRPLDGPRRQDRLAQARQARRPHRHQPQCAQHGGRHRPRPCRARSHRAGERRHRGGRRPHPQARRQARRDRHAEGGRGGARCARRRARTHEVAVSARPARDAAVIGRRPADFGRNLLQHVTTSTAWRGLPWHPVTV